MKAFRHTLDILSIMAAALVVFQGCSLVDENLQDCETDHRLNYELRLVTNMSTEINTQLETDISTDVELSAAAALRNYLSNIFTDYAHDVDLSFYDVVDDSVRLHHESHIMDANQSSYTLYIPVHRYMHTAVANVVDNPLVTLEEDEYCHKGHLHQAVSDTVGTHTTGLFTARLPMDVLEDIDQTFDVHLYMANCATALVVDTLDSHIKDLKVHLTGFATDYNICDSTYTFQYTPVVKADKLELGTPGGMCFASVNYPSRDTRPTKSIFETTDPFLSESAANSLWQIRAYATLPNGQVTETKLGVSKPLRAGQFKIYKVKALNNGSVQPEDPDIAVSVALDWQAGQEHQIEL